MRVLVTGASGFVGTALRERLRAGGHEALALRRGATGPLTWDPAAGRIDLSGAGPLDAVVHLAGESLFGLWTGAKKARIRDSRVRGTHLLAEAIGRLAPGPRALISASAIGYYGSRGDEALTEASAPGSGFLAAVAREWEVAAESAAPGGVRVVPLRFGIVLSPAGGALRLMLPPFRLGLGGVLGSGCQWMSWISLPDLLGIIERALTDPALRGPLNAVAPEPVTNRDFTQTLGRALHRPTLCPVPAVVLRAGLGQMAEEMLLTGARVLPARLQQLGYEFAHPRLDQALQGLLRRS